MWTPATRRRHSREHLRYASDVSDEEWALLEPHLPALEAVARVAHNLAGLAHVAKLPGELQQANFGPNDLLFLGHDQCPLERRGRALRTPTTPRPASAHASA